VGTPPPSAAPIQPETRASDVLQGAIGRRLIAQLTQSARTTVRAAAAQLDRGDFGGALATAPAGPDSETARLRGLAQLGQQDYAGAAATLGADFEAHPEDAGVAFVLGWARRGAGDMPGAAGAFRNAAHLEPRMVAAHLALAGTYTSLGRPALAIQALEAGLSHLPNSPELRTMIDELRKK
jgi:tetratricopeptide (TPR) repeat protein